MNYGVIIREAVRKKWHQPEQKQWWYEKFSAVRRRKALLLYDQQDGFCCYCNQLTARYPGHLDLPKRKLATLEHIIPQGKGGTDHMSNLAMSCMACNMSRGDICHHKFMTVRSDPDRWLAFLRNKSRLLHSATKLASRTKKSEKKLARQRIFIAKIAVLFIIRPEWREACMTLANQRIAERKQKLLEQAENSMFDLEDTVLAIYKTD